MHMNPNESPERKQQGQSKAVQHSKPQRNDVWQVIEDVQDPRLKAALSRFAALIAVSK